MALTVYAEKMGFFHRGSGGIGIAPIDVCLSPPPGPVPIPYTDVLFAKDLIKGSKTVRIDGEPTFLEDHSETSTSIGDEGGTLGGSVITGVILGKGYFMVWSMTVYIEGRGVCRHGDMMGQNSASAPPSSIDSAAICGHSVVKAPVPGPVAARRAARQRALDATGPGDSEPAPSIPCDFETIVLSCSHSGTGEGKRGFDKFEYRYSGTIKDNLPRSKTRPFTPNIQLTAGPEAAEADTVTLELSGGPGYGCAKTHPHVFITDRSTGVTQKHHGKTKVSFEATCKKLELPAVAYMSPSLVLAYFFFSPKTTRRYVVEVQSCGVLANKSPGFRKLSRQIDVFSSDSYKLAISIPELASRKYQASRTRALEPNATWEKGEADGWEHINEQNKPQKGPQKKLSPITKVIEDTAASVTFERNSEDIGVASTFGETVQALVNLQNEIQAVANFIDDWQPQVGWKFNFEVAVFKGDLSFEWGCKEYEDHTVFNWWKFSAEMTLVSLSLELSFGVDLQVWRYSITVIVFGNISGECKLDAAKEASPEDPTPWELGLNAEIKGTLGVRAGLGADWVKAEGTLESGFPFEARGSCSGKEPFNIDYKLAWSGVKGTVSAKIKFVGSIKREWTPWKARPIKSGSFPGSGDKNKKGIPSPQGEIE